MTEVIPRATDTLQKGIVTVQLGDETHTIATFKFGKTMKALALVAELAEAAGLGEAAKQVLGERPRASDALDGETDEGGETDALSIGDLITQLINVIPRLLNKGTGVAYSYLGLIITPNKEMLQMEEDETIDLNAELLKRGRRLAFEASTSEISTLIAAALPLMGIETVVENIAPLLGALRRK